MKQRIFILLLIVTAIYACKSKDSKEQTRDAPAVVSDTTQVHPQKLTDAYFYNKLEGTIAGKPVVMHMVKTPARIDANYYYKERGQPIFLASDWEATPDGDSIYLLEVTNAVMGRSAKLAMAINADGVNGTWVSADGSKSFPIELKAVTTTLPLLAIGATDSAIYTRFKTDTPTLKTAVTLVAVADGNVQSQWMNARIKSIIDNGSKKNLGCCRR